MTGEGIGLSRLDVELEESKHRIEHAAQATKAAVGMAYYWRRRHAGRGLRAFKGSSSPATRRRAALIIKRSPEAPLKVIAQQPRPDGQQAKLSYG